MLDVKTTEKVFKTEQAILKALIEADAAVKIGILADPQDNAKKANEKKKVSLKQGTKTTKATNVMVGAVHEFGSPQNNIPSRSFLRSTFNKKRSEIYKTLYKIIAQEIDGGGVSIDKALKKLGVYTKGLVQATFTDAGNGWKKLKDPTRGGKNKKGQATPLIDTGQLRASIGFQVVGGKDD